MTSVNQPSAEFSMTDTTSSSPTETHHSVILNASSELRSLLLGGSLPRSSSRQQLPPQQQQSHNAPIPTTTSGGAATTRKRMRTEQWNGSTTTPEQGQNFIPPTLLNLPLNPSNATFPDSSSIHIQACLENIQASLNSLHAMQFAVPPGAAASTPSSSPPSSVSATSMTLVAPAAASNSVALPDYSPLVQLPQHARESEHDDQSGSEPESSPQPRTRASPTASRKSKQRVFEKNRRDELKRQMEILSALVKFSTPTNKIGVVMATVTYLREQQALLEASQTRIKSMEVSLTESQNRVRELETLCRARAASSSCERNPFPSASSTALAPVDNGNVLMAKYQSLLHQFQDLQVKYSELSKSKSPISGYAVGTNFPRLMDSKDAISPSIQATSNDGYPLSPWEFNTPGFNSHAEEDLRTPRFDPSAVQGQVTLDASQKLSPSPNNCDSPFTTTLLFNSETTARLLTRDGIIVEISPKMLRDLGFERHELIGKPMTDITPLIKQPMTRLTAPEEHEAEPLAILDSFKTKQGGIIFLSGLLECAWDVAKCPGKQDQSHVRGRRPDTALTHEPMSYSSNHAGSNDTIEAISVNAGFCSPSSQNVNHFYFSPCQECGQRPRFGLFTGLPTYHTDMEEHIRMSVKNVVRLFDPEIKREGLQIDEFFTRGKVSYESTQQKSGSTIKVTKFLPMPFVQACSVYENMARTAFATKSNPPRIQL